MTDTMHNDKADLFFLTYTGRKFHPWAPRPEQFHIADIARGLAFSCRFNGQVRRIASIAEHSVLVARAVPRDLARAALMHDAIEAYTGDIITPVKRGLEGFEDLERGLTEALCQRYNIDPVDMRSEVIKAADLRSLVTEQRDLRGFGRSALEACGSPHAVIEPFEDPLPGLDPTTAEVRFLSRFRLFFPEFGAEAQEAIDRVTLLPDHYGMGV